jgi:hypothetical protein
MRIVFTIPSITLLIFAFAICGQNATGQSTQPLPSTQPPSAQTQQRSASGNVGSGVGEAGVGAAKGSGKIVKGTGRGIGKLFHHGHQSKTTPAPSEPQN